MFFATNVWSCFIHTLIKYMCKQNDNYKKPSTSIHSQNCRAVYFQILSMLNSTLILLQILKHIWHMQLWHIFTCDLLVSSKRFLKSWSVFDIRNVSHISVWHESFNFLYVGTMKLYILSIENKRAVLLWEFCRSSVCKDVFQFFIQCSSIHLSLRFCIIPTKSQEYSVTLKMLHKYLFVGTLSFLLFLFVILLVRSREKLTNIWQEISQICHLRHPFGTPFYQISLIALIVLRWHYHLIISPNIG